MHRQIPSRDLITIELSACPRSVPGMSLTSQLDDPASALSCFLDQAFPRLDDVSADALAQFAVAPHAVPDRGAFVPWTTIGTAVDHRMRLAYIRSAAPSASHPGTAGSCNPVTIGIEIASGNWSYHTGHPERLGYQEGAAARKSAQHWERTFAVRRAGSGYRHA